MAALAAAALALSALGAARLRAIDAGALRGPSGAAVRVSGSAATAPRPDGGGYSFELSSEAGRVLVRAPERVELPVGSIVRVGGRLARPEEWIEGRLRRRGIAMALDADRIVPTGARRGGLAGRLDAVRARAEAGLERGMPEREAALARGFVLGQDDRIDAATRADFRRSGLAHLLAVSGQNVILLCLLAWPFLALAGLTLRARLLVLLALIALYVPVAGAGPSIQRAGAMGAAGLVAALAERPLSRWAALALAAAATLALNPLVAADVGWQLSFAAVVGILLWCGRLAALLAGEAERGSVRRALADGVAVTVAATLATAPLMAHHFDSLSPAALPANLLALPAVAPSMWLGMLSAALAQVPALPLEPLNWLNSLCLAYIAGIARRLGDPGWAQVELGLGGPLQVAAAYAALAAAAELALAAGERRGGLGLGIGARGSARGRRLAAVAATAATIAALIAAAAPGRSPGPTSPGALAVRALDVGQGDAILLDPPGAAPVLVDAGPADGGAAERLRELGVESLGAVVVTHADSDHAGGLAEVLAAAPAARVLAPAPNGELRAAAERAGAVVGRLAEGGELRAGALRLSVLWPPRELLPGAIRAGEGIGAGAGEGIGAGAGGAEATGAEENGLSAVLLAEWRHFSMLLAADAEAEAVPLDPGPVDVLKLAHHGSADEGLGSLLERTVPRLAVISVGAGNPYGHPAPETLRELRSHPLRTLRTDEDGEVAIEADRAGWRVVG